jgi:hypothetical protein
MSADGADTLPPGWAQTTIDELMSRNGVFSDGDWVESKDQDANGTVRLIQTRLHVSQEGRLARCAHA